MREFYTSLSPDRRVCYDLLRGVSRSFAFVIEELPHNIRDSVCCYYLLMRALDTVEDCCGGEDRMEVCKNFHRTLTVPDHLFPPTRDTQYRDLLRSLPTVVQVFSELPPDHRDIIIWSLQVCGEGMAKFDDIQIENMEQLNEYCYYVAGIVGNGMGKLFAVTGENPMLSTPDFQFLSSENGILLQKTNIIRDYVEDRARGKKYWPYPSPEIQANEFIEHTLDAHLTHSLTNLLTVSHPKIFRCCALPTILALATLVECHSNPGLFGETPVKVSQDLAVEIHGNLSKPEDLRYWVFRLLGTLGEKLGPDKSDYVRAILKRCHVSLVNDVFSSGSDGGNPPN